MNYVLTVIKNNILDVCEIFEYLGDAFCSGKIFCDINNIEISNHNNFDMRKNGLVIADTGIYFVSIVSRTINKTDINIVMSDGAVEDLINGNQLNDIAKAIYDSKFTEKMSHSAKASTIENQKWELAMGKIKSYD